MTRSSGPDRSIAVDVLRAVAVTMVLLAHLPFSTAGIESAGASGLYPPAAVSSFLGHGHLGVQLFLVISGYCIHVRWARQPDRQARIAFLPFWRRRLTRLYPPYIIVLAGSVALALAAYRFFPANAPFQSPRQLVSAIALHLVLLQNLTQASALVGNAPFWSLALEEQLYLLYFPLLALRRFGGWRLAFGVSFAVNAVWIAIGELYLTGDLRFGWMRAGPSCWFFWALGAYVAEAHHGVIRAPAWTRSWLVLAIAVAASFALPPLFRDYVLMLSFFVLLHAAIDLETRRPSLSASPWFRPLVQLGAMSYGVYLVHLPTFVVIKRLAVALALPNILVLGIRAAAGLLVGYVVYLLLERPFLRMAQRVRVPFLPG